MLYIYLNNIAHKRELESKVEVCLQVVRTTTDNGAKFVKAFRVYGPAENEAVTIDLGIPVKKMMRLISMSLWLFSIKT